ncbi:MAG TPA: class I SAM-dependent methyltransferase [Flavobacteriaceae bacterium]|nr:class I SAM-dependent methyltransferase [Flavobacteriaceae bacterium]
MKLNTDFFAEKANDYDTNKNRTQNVTNIAQGILNEISFSKKMKIMDFGSGTGLLLSKIAPYVGKITAVDISRSMNNVLREKIIACEIQILEMDLTTEKLDEKFDSIISSMTFHHIHKVDELFKKFYSLLNNKGTIAIADLDTEDGSFHTTDTGVFHCGFDREEFKNYAKDAGFRNINIQTVSITEKPTGSYPIFLLTAEK